MTHEFFAGHGFSRLTGRQAEATRRFWNQLDDLRRVEFNPHGNLRVPVVTAQFPGCPADLPVNWLLLPERQMDYCLIRMEPGNGFPEHVHGHGEEFYLVMSGTGKVRLPGELYEARPLDIFHIRPGVPHELFNPKDGLGPLQVFAVNSPAVHHELRSQYWGIPSGRARSKGPRTNNAYGSGPNARAGRGRMV